MASKTLVLSESVRDAADLYLSVKYQPTVLINDSPCGFVRHLECRDPEKAKKLWQDFWVFREARVCQNNIFGKEIQLFCCKNKKIYDLLLNLSSFFPSMVYHKMHFRYSPKYI